MSGRILVNSSWNFAAFAFALLANFLAIPFVVNAIGLTAFGETGLMLAAFAPMSLIGTVVGQAVIHATSECQGSRGADHLDDVLWAAVVLTLTACFVTTALFCTVILVATPRLAMQGFVLADVSLPLVVGLGWTAQQLGMVLQSAFAGAQRYSDIAMATIVAAVLNVGALVVITWLNPSALGYAGGISIGFGLACATWIAWAVASFPGALRWRMFSTIRLRAIFDFGLWQSIAFLTGTGAAQIDRYLLGIWSPLKAVGQYSVALRLQEAVSMAVLKIGEVLFPHFGATRAEEVAHRTKFFVAASWLVGTVSVVFMMPLLPLAHSLISIWVNTEAADAGAPVLHMLLTAAVLGAGATVYAYEALGTGRSNELAAVNIIHAACTVAISIPMIWSYGIAGAGVGITLTNMLRLLTCWVLASRNFKGSLPITMLICLAGSPIVAGLASGWLMVAWWQPQLSSWGSLIVVYVTLALMTLAAVLAMTGFHSIGRRLLAEMYLPLAHRFMLPR